ncbi:MAG: hypothetical protein ACJAS6_000555 [Rickettsiales bacterium]|jgi:hypothetical protein
MNFFKTIQTLFIPDDKHQFEKNNLEMKLGVIGLLSKILLFIVILICAICLILLFEENKFVFNIRYLFSVAIMPIIISSPLILAMYLLKRIKKRLTKS